MGTLIAIIISCVVFFLVGKQVANKVVKKDSKKGGTYEPKKDVDQPNDKDNQE